MRQKNGSYGKTSGIVFKDHESVWWTRRIKTLENRDRYGSKYLAGVIGEKEGRKWLTEQGYEVYEFGMMAHFFDELEKAIDRLKRRRKQEYIEEDKIHINTLEHKLEGIFGEKFEEMRKFFYTVLPMRKEIRKTKQFSSQVGGVYPDFIVKKNNDFSFVEIKANTSTLSKYQRMCFKIAKSYGFKTMVLRVKVESNIPKDIHLTEL
jgi:Holliday junction resolvase-like predicted endonuclease